MTEPLNANPRRQAVPTIRGYVYQIWHSLYAWVALDNDQHLYLEGAEDFDQIAAEMATATQVKRITGTISLGTKEARKALAHFLELRDKNPGRAIAYRYLTTATPNVEHGQPFGDAVSGIDLWSRCKRSGTGIELLKAYLLKSKDLPQTLKTFLTERATGEIQAELVHPFTWETRACSEIEIERRILDQLVYIGEKLRVPPAESEKVVNRLLRETLEAATLEEERLLTRAYLLHVFDNETSVRVPRHQVQMLPVPVSTPVSAALEPLMGSWVKEDPPPSLEVLASRATAVSSCRDLLEEHGALVLTGTSGMGKTTLAKQVVEHEAKLLWVPLRSIPEDNREPLLQGLSLFLPSALEPGAIIVFDDLQEDWLSAELQDAIAHVFITVREHGGLFIATAPKRLPHRLCRIAGFDQGCHLSAPPFSRSEIEDFAELMGCPKAAAGQWSGVVEVNSHGHPQLVHANLIHLKNQEWPEIGDPLDAIFQTPAEVQQEKDDTRTFLLSRLSSDVIRFIHYISMAGSMFRRDHVLAIGERLASIEAPGITFDSLVGPWIEQIHEQYFQISPLLSHSYETALSEKRILEGRRVLAEIFTHTGTPSTIEVGTAIHHSLIGKQADTLSYVSIGMLRNWSRDVGPAIASHLSWIAAIGLDGQNLSAWCPANVVSMFRALQFRVAALAEPRYCDRIVEQWDIEVDSIANKEERTAHRFSISGTVAIGIFGTASLKCTLPYVVEFEKLRVASEADAMLSEIFSAAEIHPDFEAFLAEYPSSMNFITASHRVKTVADLAVFLDFLNALPTDTRNMLMAPMLDGAMKPSFVHGPWVSESARKEPEWAPIQEQLRLVMNYAESWKTPALYLAAGRGLVAIASEHLKDFEAGYRLLDRLEEKFGPSTRLMHQRATALFVEERYGEALQIWREVFEMEEPHPLLPKSMYSVDFTLSRRKAAIAAAETGRWKEAIELLLDGCEWAQKIQYDQSFASALKADAALCAFLDDDGLQTVGLLDSALTELETLAETQMDGNVQMTRRLVAHLILWITTTLRRRSGEEPFDLSEPWVGFCSNPNKSEELEQWPLLPIEMQLVYLSRAEEILIRRSNIFDREKHRLMNSPYATVRSEAHELDIRKDFRHCNFDMLLEKVGRRLKAMQAPMKRYQKLKDQPLPEPGEADISEVLVESREGEEPGSEIAIGIDVLVAALLCIKLRRPEEEGSTLERWNEAGKRLVFWPELPHMLSLVDESSSWSSAQAKSILVDPTQDRARRMLAALVLGTSSDFDTNGLFYAHILLFDTLSQGFWRDESASYLTELLETQWRRLAGAPALLLMPRISVPDILSACDSSAVGHKKSARILLAANYAVSLSPPDDVLRWAKSIGR